MYELTKNPDIIRNTETQTDIPRGHRDWQVYEQWLADGGVPIPLPVPTREELIAQTKALITAWLDGYVIAKGYDGIVSCISYVGDPSPRFDAEARAARAWRSAVYTAAYAVMATPPEELPLSQRTPEGVVASLPQPEDFGWPE